MIKIGWASADVSADGPVAIVGQAYERISQGCFDSTTITTLYLENGGDYVVFISGDFTYIDAQLLRDLKSRVEEKIPGFDGKKILFNATHSHTAPRYQLKRNYDKAPKDRVNLRPPEIYREFLLNQLTNAVYYAYENAKPGSIAYGYGSAAVAHSRRVTYFTDQGIYNKKGNTFGVNGHGKMYGKTNDPQFSGYEGPTDANVYLLFTFDENENLTGAIVNVPCPSQCTEMEEFTSADYWNETRQMIREKFGNIYILPQCAAAGDLSPHPLHNLAARTRKFQLRYGQKPEAAQFRNAERYYDRLEIAQKITQAVEDGYSWASKEKIKDLSLVHITKTVELEKWQISQQEYEDVKNTLRQLSERPFQRTEDPYDDFRVNTRLSAEITRCEEVIALYERESKTIPMEIHILKLGDVAFTACPSELFIDFQHRIQARSPFVQTFMVQLTASDTDIMSEYQATERAAKNKGYSAIPFSCSVSPAGGQAMVEDFLETLQEIYEK